MIAILMAAGLGTRLLPLTKQIPKPLITVMGKPMIETIINGLVNVVDKIYIIVGYKKEQFSYLSHKYPNINFIDQIDYLTVNNISAINAASDILGTDDCFICEADLYVSDPNIFNVQLNHSCYYGKFVAGHSNDWVFEQDYNGRITRVGKCGDNVYNMCGIAWFTKNDSIKLKQAIKETCSYHGTYEHLFWDDVVNQQLQNIDLIVHPVNNDQIIEIDNILELQAIDSSYK